jgi:RNase adaptor protein for sRNA GlmZ degradation
MHIIKICGIAGSGKSEVLNTISDGVMTTGDKLEKALPVLMEQLAALSVNTYVDNVSEAQLVKFKRLAKLYPSTYRMYVCVEGGI